MGTLTPIPGPPGRQLAQPLEEHLAPFNNVHGHCHHGRFSTFYGGRCPLPPPGPHQHDLGTESALDAANNRLYVTNYNNGTVAQVNNVGGTPTVVPAYAAGFTTPFGVALDAANNRRYVANVGNNTVAQVNNVGSTPTVVPAYAAGFNTPAGVALGP